MTRLKRESVQTRKMYAQMRNEENRVAKNRAQEIYSREMKRAKNDKWRQFCGTMENTTAAAKLHRLMKNGRMADIGTLKKTDGTYTSTEKETLDELLEQLIPTNPTLTNTI